MKEEFLNWHRVCLLMTADASEIEFNVSETESNVSETELNKNFKEKLGFLNLMTEMLRTANPETVSSLEDILSEKLSSEAVHRLVTIQYQSLKIITVLNEPVKKSRGCKC
jgi:hypothetical protein